jgi:hypothetical protein
MSTQLTETKNRAAHQAELVGTIGDNPPMSRSEAAAYIKARYGLLSGRQGALAKLAMGGGDGPLFHKVGQRKTVYFRRDVDSWAVARLGEARVSFSGKAA